MASDRFPRRLHVLMSYVMAPYGRKMRSFDFPKHSSALDSVRADMVEITGGDVDILKVPAHPWRMRVMASNGCHTHVTPRAAPSFAA